MGGVRYADAMALQSRLVEQRRAGAIRDTLLLLEHPPVITLGRGSDRAHLLADEDERSRLGIELHECGRGGEVTYHGPGQLVGYPIIALERSRRDAHRYLRDLEAALRDAVGDLGLETETVAGLTGVWVGNEKLAAIGVRLSTGWITSHGFALNVDNDLSGFSTIVPCGLTRHGVTSLAHHLRPLPPLGRIATRVALRLAERLGRQPRFATDSQAAEVDTPTHGPTRPVGARS